jgi:N-dimethylarginine dimethylaminohydrolase
MLSKNEWDPLVSVIVGIADDATIPLVDPSLRTVNYADQRFMYKIPQGPYPQQVIDEANEDLSKFVDFLKSLDITVYRPDSSIVPNYYNYCPRDTVLVHDDLILATPNPLKARKFEFRAMENTLRKHGNLTVKTCSHDISLYNSGCLGNPDILALNETEPAFDAANILRDNDNLYYLVSNSGNKVGAQYLQELCPDKKVYTIEGVYSYMHLDSTICLLREGLMLLNPSRIKSLDQLPEPLRKWDHIWCPEPIDIGHYPGYCNASTWINMNLFSVNPNLVALEENQTNLRDELAKYGIESEMLPMRHQRTLGGGFHCVTLDLERKHV